ncbi:hypothetical protein OVA24_10190 [Luteolibacter sp. SL250]|uniref:hypothetical protein n=1 Tax=Luteolibacter sp. SL250 TaxID=2995170 RepID=UPI00226D428B|nr:hypothetical protein [Luteolibacter sp. SL250]WAC21754.1 hypothetical protein OVA24_10190 [Luteolibacter sp. SL250]
MKPKTFSDAPGWEFRMDEVSANVFVVVGSDAEGRTIEKIGTDPYALLGECHQEAKQISSPQGDADIADRHDG